MCVHNSISHSVGLSIGPSVFWSVPLVRKQAKSVQKGCFSAGGIDNVTAPAQKHATDAAVYTALLLSKHPQAQGSQKNQNFEQTQ